MVEGAALEKRCVVFLHREFESPPLRHKNGPNGPFLGFTWEAPRAGTRGAVGGGRDDLQAACGPTLKTPGTPATLPGTLLSPPI